MITRSGWQHRLIVPQFTLVTGMLVVAVGAVVMASPFCSNDDVCWWEGLFTVTSVITVMQLSIIGVGTTTTTFALLRAVRGGHGPGAWPSTP